MTSMPDPMLQPGYVVAGRFRIEQLIGRGGFGAVYRATQVHLGRSVALKVLLPDLVADDEGLSRFRREAELAQRLTHPNTVRLLDFGQAEDRIPFIAFELLKGQALDERLKLRGGMSPLEVGRVTSQVLKSLMEAHAAGIVHRDIKPSNIFLCDYPGEPDFVKLLDFGIAKSQHRTGTTQAVTRFGHTVGTPHYMSPEQVNGGDLTPASDLYSLGLVMSEALTGRLVFQGDSPLQVCIEQASATPAPIPPDVMRSAYGAVIHRATQKDWSRRFGSAAEMLQEVERAMAGLSGGYAATPGPAAPVHAPSAAPLAYQPTHMVDVSAAYAPQPQGYGPYPHAATPAYQPYPQPSSSSGALVVLLFVAAALVLLGGAGIVVVLVSRHADPTETASNTDTDGPVDLDGLSLEQTRARVEEAGWTILGESSSHQDQVSTFSLTVRRSDQFGIVLVYKFADESIATMTESSLRGRDGALRRDGGTLLYVTISQNDAASRELAASIVPGSP